MIEEKNLRSWLPVYGLLIRMERFRVMSEKGTLICILLTIVLAMSTILTFAGTRGKGVSRYLFVMIFVFVAFDYVIWFITDFETTQRHILLFGEDPDAYKALLRLSRVFSRYTEPIWCCVVPVALFVTFFITLSTTRERLFFATLSTYYEVRKIICEYPFVYHEKIRLLVVSIAVFCLLLLLFIILIDMVRPILYSFFGAFFLCYVIYATGINSCGFKYVLTDNSLQITDWLPIMLTAGVGLVLQLLYVFRTKKTSSYE
eukprot:jgi/Antlo1/1410/1377